MTRLDCDIMIVGLGPTGAVLAALLGARGIRTIAIEKDRDPYPLPRAAHFDHEVMRVFQQLGLTRSVLENARPAPAYEFRSSDGRLLLKMDPPPLPSPSGWEHGYMFHQPALERALRTRLAELPSVEARFETRLEGLEPMPDCVEVRTSGVRGEEAVRCGYVVGCDGASSAVRESVGGGLVDFQFDEPWLVVDVVVLDAERLPKVNLQICDPRRPTTCVLMGPGRHRWEFMMLEGERPEDVLKDAFIENLLQRWDCGDAVKIERKAVYRFHGLLAERWRTNRVLLAGDAAHQMPPFAGQGLCSGVRDAANLAWKLAAVVMAGASPTLLDTYEAERSPNVRGYIELAIGMGRVVCTVDPQAAAARDAAMAAQREAGVAPLAPLPPKPFGEGAAVFPSSGAGSLFPQIVAQVGGEPLRLDDVLGDGAWLLSKELARAPAGVKVWTLDAPVLAPFRDELVLWLDRRQGRSVLVRPDRYVFGVGDPEALAASFAAWIGPDCRLADVTAEEAAAGACACGHPS